MQARRSEHRAKKPQKRDTKRRASPLKERTGGGCTGFTLLELSIVMMIIGFVMAAILVGRELIHSAELRGVVRQLEEYDAAATTFKAKYGCLPGDCPSATEVGLGEPGCPPGFYDVYGVNQGDIQYAGCNGNGDGRFEVTAYIHPEHLNYWYHMQQAGLITGPLDGKSITTPAFPAFGRSMPLTKLRDVGIATKGGQHMTIGHPHVLGDKFGLLVGEAQYIDCKMDDCAWSEGRMSGFFWSSPCWPSSPTEYDTAGKEDCRSELFVKLPLGMTVTW